MKITPFLCAVALVCPAWAQQPAPRLSVRPAVKKAPLLNTQIAGRDMMFITKTMDQLRTLELLALHASVTRNKELSEFGRQVTRSMSQHASVLSTLAEMRSIPDTPRESPLRKDYIKQLADDDDKRMESRLLDLLLATDRELLATLKGAEASQDAAVREFVANLLPELGMQAKTIASFHAANRPPVPKPAVLLPPVSEASASPRPVAVPAKPAKPLPKVKKRDF